MWTFQHTETTTATPEQLWQLYQDPTTWSEWDHQIEDVTVDGPFETGATGTIKPVGGPRTKFRMVEVTEKVSFTDVTRLPLAKMRFDHWIEPGTDETTFIHRVTITGPLTPLFARVIGRKVADELPAAMRTLAARAEQA
jgi:hypothetical protein